MKPIFWIMLLVVITLGSYWFHQKESSVPVRSTVPTPMNATSSAEEKPLKKTEAHLESISPTIAPKISIQTVPKPRPHEFATKPKDMIVQFEVIDGLAVAYGDTILGKPMSDFTETRGATEIRPPKFWDHGIVPYAIKEDVVNPDRIKKVIEYFNQNTSVRFVPFENQADAIVFVRGEKNCYSFLGRTGGAQPVYLSEKCGTPEIMHELMHALGFIHEQSRTDRDQFIDVLWNNIEEAFQSQYAMVPDPLMEPYFDSAFDPSSIMMYDAHMFSIRPDLETMKLKNGNSLEMISRKLSHADIERINRLYLK